MTAIIIILSITLGAVGALGMTLLYLLGKKNQNGGE